MNNFHLQSLDDCTVLYGKFQVLSTLYRHLRSTITVTGPVSSYFSYFLGRVKQRPEIRLHLVANKLWKVCKDAKIDPTIHADTCCNF